MEENETKVETDTVVETVEITDETPVESQKMSPKEKKAFRVGIVANDDQGFVFSEE